MASATAALLRDLSSECLDGIRKALRDGMWHLSRNNRVFATMSPPFTSQQLVASAVAARRAHGAWPSDVATLFGQLLRAMKEAEAAPAPQSGQSGIAAKGRVLLTSGLESGCQWRPKDTVEVFHRSEWHPGVIDRVAGTTLLVKFSGMSERFHWKTKKIRRVANLNAAGAGAGGGAAAGRGASTAARPGVGAGARSSDGSGAGAGTSASSGSHRGTLAGGATSPGSGGAAKPPSGRPRPPPAFRIEHRFCVGQKVQVLGDDQRWYNATVARLAGTTIAVALDDSRAMKAVHYKTKRLRAAE